MTKILLPDLPGFSIEQITIAEGVIMVLAHSQATSGPCPDCGHLSSRIHSRYQRKLADLPWSEYSVRLVVQVHRFFCTHASCTRKTFAEALPALAERSARRTTRLKKVLERLGLTLGGEAAARLTTVLGMGSSPDTLLRLLRRLSDDPIEPPRVVSLDDWAWRRGHRYGTIICDLERHRRLDVLADREALSVSAWLKRYPSIEIISRDRSDIYAQAARLGAPQAVQVTDKWHLLKNLSEALQRLLARHLAVHRTQLAHQTGALPVLERHARRPRKLTPKVEHLQKARREERMALYHQVVAFHKQGLSQAAIAERVGIGHSTVSNWLRASTFPERKLREQASRLDPYLPSIWKLWDEGCHNIARIYRELVAHGYKGAYASVYHQLVRLLPEGRKNPASTRGVARPPAPSRQAAFLFLRRPGDLTAEEQETVTQLRQRHPEVDLAYDLVQQFVQMMRTRQGVQLDDWLERGAKSDLSDLHPFVAGVSQDQAAVQAGLTLPWSQGQSEGQITRLKLIKRQGYGRAKFDLLRQRVLHAT